MISLGTLREFAKTLDFYEKDAWMGDYDPDEVGAYLAEHGFNVWSSGGRSYLQNGDNDIPTRGGFILWWYQKVHDDTKERLDGYKGEDL